MATPRTRRSDPADSMDTAMPLPADSPEGDSDAELVGRLARGDEQALRVLHRRYASLLFTVATRTVDASAAEEVVQDVFMALWRKHETFDATRGTLKSWLCQVAHHRALNVRRGRRRDAKTTDGPVEEIEDEALKPDEALWKAHRQSALHAAVDALPDAQRRALSLAFFDELTQEQIASLLHVPLGTTKTRIRLAMRRIAPALIALAGAGLVFVLWRRKELEAARDERALTMVTSSDVVAHHLGPAPGAPPETHANYRVRPGGTVAVLTASHLPSLAAGERYVGWVRHGTDWLPLGELAVRADGGSLLLVESSAVAVPADEVTITRETTAGPGPRGAVVVQWLPSPR
jgi:RNA polymerase sigma factor (sigma-70 family)